jgi:hypothetical protein
MPKDSNEGITFLLTDKSIGKKIFTDVKAKAVSIVGKDRYEELRKENPLPGDEPKQPALSGTTQTK